MPDAETVFPSAPDFPAISAQPARSYGLVFKVPEAVVQICKANGIDLEKANGDISHELPMAGTFIIDRNGKVLLAFVEADYKKRLPVARILEVLDSMRR